MKANICWKENLRLEGFTDTGHKVQMDSVPEMMPSAGPTPKELILQALAGCTMMNVAAIINKSRKKLDKFWVEIDSVISDEIPYSFETIVITYNFVSEELTGAFIENAVKLSLQKYCTVSAMLKDSIKISYSYNIIKSNITSTVCSNEAVTERE